MKPLLLFLLISITGFTQETDTVSIYFGVDASVPNTKQAFEPFDKNSRIVRIEGHCDVSGSVAYNKRLAQKRIDYATQQLTALGYSIEKAQLIPHGESQAAAQGWSDFHARRVDIIYVEPNIRGTGLSVIEPIDSQQAVTSEPTQERTVEATENFSKDAVQAFLEDDSAHELKLDMTILFFNASDRVLPESEPEMKELLKVMKKHPELNAVIHGHVCCSDNQKISEARARAVAMYLINNNISNERLSYEGHSNTQPKVWPEVTEVDQKMNRRVSIVFKK